MKWLDCLVVPSGLCKDGITMAFLKPDGHQPTGTFIFMINTSTVQGKNLMKRQMTEKLSFMARVSTSSQKEDLKNRIEFLKTFANAKGIIVDEISTDIESE